MAELRIKPSCILVSLILLISPILTTTWSSLNTANPSEIEIDQIPATYHGLDVFREPYTDVKATGSDFIDQHFYLCYHKDGRKTYYKKLNPTSFTNKRYWIITASGKFVVSMQLC